MPTGALCWPIASQERGVRLALDVRGTAPRRLGEHLGDPRDDGGLLRGEDQPGMAVGEVEAAVDIGQRVDLHRGQIAKLAHLSVLWHVARTCRAGPRRGSATVRSRRREP